MYQYYQLVESTEHYLLQKEIAAMAGIMSSTNKPHTRLVGLLLQRYMEKHKLPHLFYFSSLHKRLLEVYPQSVYMEMLAEFDREHKEHPGEITIDGKCYHYVRTTWGEHEAA